MGVDIMFNGEMLEIFRPLSADEVNELIINSKKIHLTWIHFLLDLSKLDLSKHVYKSYK